MLNLRNLKFIIICDSHMNNKGHVMRIILSVGNWNRLHWIRHIKWMKKYDHVRKECKKRCLKRFVIKLHVEYAFNLKKFIIFCGRKDNCLLFRVSLSLLIRLFASLWLNSIKRVKVQFFNGAKIYSKNT